MRRIMIILMILVVLLCSGIVVYKNFLDKSKVKRIDIRGSVKNITIYGDTASILVEGNIENDTYYTKASISIDNNTSITKVLYTKRVDISQIKVGDIVEVTFDGAVAESYPVQAKAKIINIIK